MHAGATFPAPSMSHSPGFVPRTHPDRRWKRSCTETFSCHEVPGTRSRRLSTMQMRKLALPVVAAALLTTLGCAATQTGGSPVGAGVDDPATATAATGTGGDSDATSP